MRQSGASVILSPDPWTGSLCSLSTPTIIRFPFEKLTREHDNITLVRLNLDQAVIPESLGNRAIGINADMAESISDILNVSVSHPYPAQEQ